jgi:hypothetical protein
MSAFARLGRLGQENTSGVVGFSPSTLSFSACIRKCRSRARLLNLFLAWDCSRGVEPKETRSLFFAISSRPGSTLTSIPATGIMRLDGAADGAQLRIEDDMLDAELRPERGHYASVDEQLSAIGDDVWDRHRMSTALKSWASALHPDSEWSADLMVAAGAAEKPMVTFAPALILRKRTQTGMVRIYEAMIARLNGEKEEVPPGWSGLVEDADDHDVPGSTVPFPEGPTEPSLDRQEVYFPLPANREQRRIVEAISRRRGVLVQGPPGTGKSHTIANLVCHLLATGKRVLITAETGRALKVLKSKLPKGHRRTSADLRRRVCVSRR